MDEIIIADLVLVFPLILILVQNILMDVSKILNTILQGWRLCDINRARKLSKAPLPCQTWASKPALINAHREAIRHAHESN